MPLPILIAGPTASGKSALALALAEHSGATVVNADALQVYADWNVLTARPPAADLGRARHALYGHVPFETRYSVGDWLREVADLLSHSAPLIIVGGTGLYLTTLLRGLAQIPPIPDSVREEAETLRACKGLDGFRRELETWDPVLYARMDRQNGMRLQRAWEVFRATGTPLSTWQAETPPPLVSPKACVKLVLSAERDWLAERIFRRFDMMMSAGALEEARALLPRWDPELPAAKALGAPELIAHLRGEMDLAAATEQAKTATRQFAKRQRTWFRSNMKGWDRLSADAWSGEVAAILDRAGA